MTNKIAPPMDPPTIAPKFEWLVALELAAPSLVCSGGGTVRVRNFEVTIPSGRVEILSIVVGMADDRGTDKVEAEDDGGGEGEGEGEDGGFELGVTVLGVEIGVGWFERLLGRTQLLPKSVDTTTELI